MCPNEPHGCPGNVGACHATEQQLAVAQGRYAAGEISREQFEEICRALSRHERADGHADV